MTKPYDHPSHLTADQLYALRAYSALHGHTWKSQLNHEWLVGCNNPYLQQIRNQYGPSWLAKLTLTKLEEAYSNRFPDDDDEPAYKPGTGNI